MLFPCCVCKIVNWDLQQSLQHRLDMSSYASRIMWIFKEVLVILVQHISPNMWNYHFDTAKGKLQYSTDKERNVSRSLIKLLIHCYEKDSSKINIDNVENWIDIGSILIQKLETITEMYIKAFENPFEIVSGKTNYQKFVVDCLYSTAILMAQCIDNFKCEKDEKDTIFNHLFSIMKYYFERNNIFQMVAHDIQRIEPFGIISDDEIKYSH